jgi:glucosamine kinase
MIEVLGVDGGQSGIRLRRSGSTKVVEVEGVSHLEGDTVGAVATAIVSGWAQLEADSVQRVVLGLSTAPAGVAGRDRLSSAIATATSAEDVWLADDAVTAHAGALSLGWGISLVVGTGVACLALPQAGRPRIIGGDGYLLGDEGGGFWIGRRALSSVLRLGQGRERPGHDLGVLTAAAKARFGASEGLGARLHGGERPVHAIAGFARDVQAAADTGDEASIAILREAIAELIPVIEAGVRWAGGPAGPVPLALGGRLLVGGTPLRRLLDEGLERSGLQVVPRSADGTGLDGAIALGIADGDHPYGSLVHRWRTGVPA